MPLPLPALPVTPNGKLDRDALPDPLALAREGTREHVAPDGLRQVDDGPGTDAGTSNPTRATHSLPSPAGLARSVSMGTVILDVPGANDNTWTF